MIMHQLDARIGRLLKELKSLTVRASTPVSGITVAEKGTDKFEPFQNGSEWGNTTLWWDFRFDAVVPEGYKGRVLLSIRTGMEAGWEATSAQFVVRVNGKVEQAFDTKHTDMTLQETAKPGETYHVVLNAYAAERMPGQRPPILEISLNDVNENLNQLVYDISVPYETVMLMRAEDREREVTLEILARALDLLDLREPHSEAFDRSVAEARAYLEKEFYAKRKDLLPVAIAECVGHTHIDVAWLWDLYQTRHKAVRSFSTVLKLMERYPEYKFMSSQAALYKMVKEDEPELFERIKKAVADGRWEVEGGMWVEADCNLAGGESLVRQFLHGQEFFTKEFGKPSRILWLPDVFGYSAALPQILKQSGIDYFMTTKLSWSEYNLSPYDTFTWKGIDGSEVLSHFSPSRDFQPDTVGERHQELQHFTTYNAMLNPNQIAGGWKRFQQKGLDNHYLVSYGFGDGGGGPTEWMLENGRRMATPLPALPVVKQQFARDFFEALEARVKDDARLPKWYGELYLEYHRGTYTAVGKNKRNNRKIEIALREAEILRVYAEKIANLPYPAQELHDIWEDTLTLQFHDILPGSSIKKVYDDSDEMYRAMFEKLAIIKEDALNALAKAGKGDVAAFNPQPHAQGNVLWFDAPEGTKSLLDAKGVRHPAQKVGDKYACFIPNLAPMTDTPLWFCGEDAPCAGDTVHADEKGFETPFFKGEFDGAMRITSLYDKKNAREVAKKGQALNRIVCYENKPHNFDAWDINIYYDRRHWEVDGLTKATVIASGPVLAIIRCEYAYMRSAITQDVIIYRDLPRIDFETTVDWKEKQYLLKAHFPVDVFYNEATYDIQYGNVKRATHKNTSWDVARFETCAHKWVDVSEDGYGVSLLNDCKYGHSVDENGIALTLLKSSTLPNPEADTDMEHHFTYSLMPHTGDWRCAATPNAAYALNMPATVRKAGGEGEMLRPLFTVSNENILVEVVKKALDGDGVIVRVYECYGRRTAGAVLESAFGILSCEESNMLEQKQADAPFDGNTVSFDMRPYEIKTFRIRW
ncbi:MAG: alpha-mannosidase [Christensenellales bacterium]|jgi:alpha-mannosidase